MHSLVDVGHETSVSRLTRSRFRGEQLTVIPDLITVGSSDLSDPSPPEVIFADTSRMVETADRMAEPIDAWVARRPDWPAPRRDLIAVAPSVPRLSVPAGQVVPELAPWSAHRGRTPQGRHERRIVVLVYRSTPGSPGHYLYNALVRAGVTVRVAEEVDLDDHRDADAVVVVESPTPAVELRGEATIPIVFWVHHGEHHLEGNLRLSRRYGADLVLLAHSWHLAARFDTRVERFPFAAAPELMAAPPAFTERPIDLAFVGTVEGTAYERRRRLLDQARSSLAKVEVADQLSPVEMSDLYRRSRSVLNEGGSRHRPVTMRVFEAMGAGALLLSEPAPGIDLLFGGLYEQIPEDGLTGVDLDRILGGPGAVSMATAAHNRTLEHHTYDHRVDLLFRFVDDAERHGRERTTTPGDPISRFLYHHPYGQRILDDTDAVREPDREVWRTSVLDEAPGPRTFDTVVLDRRSSTSLALCARRFVIGRGIDVAALPLEPRRVTRSGDLTVVDVGGDGYDLETVGGPPAIPLM